MAAIVHERTIAAAPQRVWSALTEQDEIVHWWAEAAHVTLEIGALCDFRFRPPAGDLQFEVVKLDPNHHLRWLSRQGPPSWAETNVTWQLTSLPNGTRVVFTHDGFAQVDASFERKRENWAYFLDSLQSYLEMGHGAPGTPPFLLLTAPK